MEKIILETKQLTKQFKNQKAVNDLSIKVKENSVYGLLGPNGAYNWWVVMFLPGLIAILAAMIIGREKNLEYKGLFLYPKEKALFWIGKTLYVSLLFLFSSLIFMLGIAMMGLFDQATISLPANVLAMSILILTFLFQIPICMFLADRFNLFVATLFNVGMVILAVVSYWNGIDYSVFPIWCWRCLDVSDSPYFTKWLTRSVRQSVIS